MTDRRIIPISSGKGGVGKTTFALNYALSLARYGKTLLVDLDTGTSSVRNCLDVPVNRDLYHFFKKGYRLEDCAATLDARLDPDGLYGNFAFVAAPRHLIEDITNFNAARREQLIEGLNGVGARYVVLDLKAGLDPNVIEFLPYSNSGVLVFTPHLPAATLAAADIVKSILFRKLRVLFAPDSPVYNGLAGMTPSVVNSLIDSVEDVYDSSVHTLDAFVQDLEHALGDTPVVRLVESTVESFVVHYVLNRFDGVKKSYDTAVKPFLESLADNVSAELTILNLGWIVEHEDINESNIRRVPVLLRRDKPEKVAAAAPSAAMKEIEKLAALHLPGRGSTRPHRTRAVHANAKDAPRTRSERYLDAQLDTLRHMFEDVGGAGYVDNFRYITSRSLHVMKSRRTSEFGDTRLLSAAELQQTLQLGALDRT
jgi:MinD-like ATPase involved in chromosome partitioning or flagellar assembly